MLTSYKYNLAFQNTLRMYKLGLKYYLAMESIVAIFNVVYTCCTASYKAVSGLIASRPIGI